MSGGVRVKCICQKSLTFGLSLLILLSAILRPEPQGCRRGARPESFVVRAEGRALSGIENESSDVRLGSMLEWNLAITEPKF